MQGIYCGPTPLPLELWTRWNFDPGLLLLLGALALGLRGSRAGLGSVVVLALTFVSPLCALSAALFSARVVHHVLIIAIAAPLMAVALRQRLPSAPMLSLFSFALVLWLWHVPAAYDLALSNKAVYWFMQATLLASAVWFWQEVLRPDGSSLIRVPLVVAAFAQMGLLGALLTFAPSPLYAIHAIAPYNWGLTPVTDQQLGGLIMWLPAGVPFAIVAVLLVRRSLPHSAGAAS